MVEIKKVVGYSAVAVGIGLFGWYIWPLITGGGDGGDGDDWDDIPEEELPVAARILVTASPVNRGVQAGGVAKLNITVKNHTTTHTVMPVIRMVINLGSKLLTYNPIEGGTKDFTSTPLAPGASSTFQLSATIPSGWNESHIKWGLFEISDPESAELVAQSTTSNDFLIAVPEALDFLACEKVTAGNYMWPGESVTVKVQVSNPSSSSITLQMGLEYLFERATSTYHWKSTNFSALTISPGTKWYSITMTMPHWDIAMEEDIKDYGTVKCKVLQKTSDGKTIERLVYPNTPTWIFIRGDDETKLKFNSCSLIGSSTVGPGYNAICGLNITNTYPCQVKLGLLMRLGGDNTMLGDWIEDESQLSPVEVTLPAGTNTVSLHRMVPDWDRPGADIKDGGRMECEIFTFNLISNTLRKLIVYSPIFTNTSMMQGIVSPRWIYDRDL